MRARWLAHALHPQAQRRGSQATTRRHVGRDCARPGGTYRTVPYGAGKEALRQSQLLFAIRGRRIRFSFEWTAPETTTHARPGVDVISFPDGKGLGESTVTRWALFDGENGAAAVHVDDGISNHERSLRSCSLRSASDSSAESPIMKNPFVTLTASPASRCHAPARPASSECLTRWRCRR